MVQTKPRSPVKLLTDDTWRAGQVPATGLLRDVGPAAEAAGAVYAYARDLAPEGSVTALLPRLVPPR